MLPCVRHGEEHGKYITLYYLGNKVYRFVVVVYNEPFKVWFSNVDRRWGHMSWVFWRHSEQLV